MLPTLGLPYPLQAVLELSYIVDVEEFGITKLVKGRGGETGSEFRLELCGVGRGSENALLFEYELCRVGRKVDVSEGGRRNRVGHNESCSSSGGDIEKVSKEGKRGAEG